MLPHSTRRWRRRRRRGRRGIAYGRCCCSCGRAKRIRASRCDRRSGGGSSSSDSRQRDRRVRRRRPFRQRRLQMLRLGTLWRAAALHGRAAAAHNLASVDQLQAGRRRTAGGGSGGGGGRLLLVLQCGRWRCGACRRRHITSGYG